MSELKNINRNKTILKANSLESTKNLLDIFLLEKGLKKLNKNEVKKFFVNWVKKRSKYEQIKHCINVFISY